MANSKEFKNWVKMESARRVGTLADIDAKIEREMKKVKVEGKDENGRWTELTDLGEDNAGRA